jgi:elongation factor G
MKLKVTVLNGEWNEQSDVRAMKIAAADAFNQGLEQGGKVLLEPIMKLDIVTPQDYLGDFVGDLQQRRATIARTDQRGAMTTIEAHAPLKELFGYSSAMRSLSQGRAGASIEPLRYDPAPPEVLKAFEI